jgi:hypothetical protein
MAPGPRLGSGYWPGRRAVEDARVVRQLARVADQRARRHRRPALVGHQHLALGHERGGEVEDERLGVPVGTPIATGLVEKRRSRPP